MNERVKIDDDSEILWSNIRYHQYSGFRKQSNIEIIVNAPHTVLSCIVVYTYNYMLNL
jgi:hypothetical protein